MVRRLAAAALLAVPTAALAATATTTTLTTNSSSGAYTLTAVVKAGGTTLTLGQVNFCDATVSYCTDAHLLGSAQITSAGTATMVFRPGVIAKSVRAVFAGTTTYTASTSSNVALAVLLPQLTPIVTLTAVGSAGNYGLTAKVKGNGAQSANPSGTLAFQDTTAPNNYALQTGTLGSPVTATFGFTSAAPLIGGNALIDFNHDGYPDLVSLNGGQGVVTLGDGTGAYNTYNANYICDSNFNNSVNVFGGIAVGDFNSDGNLDFVMVGSSILRVFLGSNGNGFTQLADVAIPAGTNYLAVGDFNGDGKPDVVYTTGPQGTYTVLLGRGDGTFAAMTAVSTGGYPLGIYVADINNDGKQDFATINGNSVGIYVGNGDGTFTAKATAVAGPGGGAFANYLAFGDFNGDGKLDLAVSFANAPGLELALGNGDGTFAAANVIDASSTGFGVAVGDFNGDGKLDVAVAYSGSASVDVLLGSGGSTAGSFTKTSYSGGSDGVFVAVGDFNVDGLPDIILTSGNQSGNLSLASGTQTQVSIYIGAVSPSGNGTHYIQAAYMGDTHYVATTSATVGLTAQLKATVTVVTAAPTTTYVGGQVALTATVSPTTTEGYTNNGNTVTFMDGSTNLGTANTSSGVATLNVTSLSAGTHSITAVFAGDGGGTWAGSTSAAVNYLVKYPPVVAISGSQPVGTSSSPQTVTFLFSGSVTTASTLATAIQVTSKGGVTTEFTYASGGTCLPSHAYTYGQSCTVNVVFTPLYPGLRQGGVTLVSTALVSITSVQLSGQATSSQGVFRATTATAFATSIPSGSGTALDGAGNVWVCSGTTVKEFSPTGTLLTTISGYSTASAIALDGAGNIYVADTGTGAITMATAVGAVKTSVISASGVTGMALDAAGDLYYSTAASVFELPVGATTATVLAAASSTKGIALDGSGNLFYMYGAALHEIDAGNGANTVVPVSPLTLTANYISGIALDAGENIYLTDNGIGRIVELPNGGTPFVLMTSGTSETAPSVAPNGNLIYSDPTLASTRQLNRAAPTVTFPSTASGSSSAQQVLTVESIGTQALNVNALSITGPFNLNGAGTTCATPVQLNPGQTCGLGVIMAPVTAGAQTGTVVLTDDSLGGSASTQTATLTGTATQLAQTITFPQPANGPTGSPITLSATASSGLAITYTVTAGTGTISGNTITPTSVGTVTITANQPGNIPYAAATAVSKSITVSKGGQTITFPALPASVVNGSASQTLAATATSGLAVTYTVTGPAYITGNQLSFTGDGTVAVTASQAGTANFSAATPVTQTVTVTAAAGVPQYSSSQPTGSTTTFSVGVPFTSAFTIGSIGITSQGAPGTPAVAGAGSSCSAGGSVAAGDVCSINTAYTSTGPGVVTILVSIYDTAGNLQGSSTIVIVQYH